MMSLMFFYSFFFNVICSTAVEVILNLTFNDVAKKTRYRITRNAVIRRIEVYWIEDTWDMAQYEMRKNYSFKKYFRTTELCCKKEGCQKSILLATERHSGKRMVPKP